MTTAAKTASKLLVTLKDPTGRKRAAARRQLIMTTGAAAAGSLLALALGTLERRRRRTKQQAQAAPQQQPRTAGVTTPGGGYRSRHGAGAGPLAGHSPGPILMGDARRSPLDTLAAHAERIQDAGSDEPGFSAHLGFGIGGQIPAAQMGDAFPTGGGDALGNTLNGGEAPDARYGDEIVTGAGEAMSNSTTPSSNGHGKLH